MAVLLLHDCHELSLEVVVVHGGSRGSERIREFSSAARSVTGRVGVGRVFGRPRLSAVCTYANYRTGELFLPSRFRKAN